MKTYYNIFFIILLILFISFGCVNAVKIGGEKPSLVDTVIITNNNWADCVVATEYAYKINGIVLQTESDHLNINVEDMIKSINPKRIVIVGGPLAVSKNVEDSLKKYGEVVRIWGPTRVETDENILKLLNSNNTKVLVNGYNFSEVIIVASNNNIPVYAGVEVYNPNEVIRVYGNSSVKIYSIHDKRFIGEYSKDNVLEIPKKVIILNKPNIDVKYCYDDNIHAFGYPKANITTDYNNSEYNILLNKNSTSALTLLKYLNIPITTQSNKDILSKFNSDAVNNSITVAVDILVLEKTMAIYKQNGDLGQSLDEAKTQLWSKNIPVEKYNIPYNYLESYVNRYAHT
ncbi:cell wall-binding repeat-containing protein [Methanothermococcus okinawensis]|uniref:Cell wall binding repeat 2-containing protein n=1 Tax=Methanothermococcus okinawensis (strain DSM 14208 / JCM 11175 / IH1) TaxID=647113 RepID=F8AKD8_METOI|nr:cell wall-binding protein [Methanothermococcus okinawensis]AEH06338.1 cell wall binding repeat 2-containing protein [Methanothermococcus okinawensis IH1]